MISQFAYEYLQEAVTDVLPALGTHAPMTEEEISKVSNDLRCIALHGTHTASYTWQYRCSAPFRTISSASTTGGEAD